jgi:hypothetical protein
MITYIGTVIIRKQGPRVFRDKNIQN